MLVDKHENYRRTNATLRVLSPLIGAGLLLSEGRDCRFQRRTLAPAFTPKAVSLLIPHMLAPTDELVTELRAKGDEPANLFLAVQHLALEIAARTMFSLEMREHGPAFRHPSPLLEGILSRLRAVAASATAVLAEPVP